MKTIAKVFECECGKHYIILNDNFEGVLTIEHDLYCPICGEAPVSECIRNIEINRMIG